MKKHEFTEEQIQKIKEDYYNRKPWSIIAKELGLATDKAVRRIVKEKNFVQCENVYEKNIHIFDVIDTADKAYWLGFINGDGYVNKKFLSIKLARRDRDHLEKFADFMNMNRDTIKDSMGTYNNPISYIYVSSAYFIDKLHQIGISAGKSDKEHVPANLPYKFIRDYLRGLFDADGCILKNRIDLSGSLENINFMQTYYHIKYNIEKPTIHFRGNVHRTFYRKKKSRKLILYDLYYPSVNTYLTRKYKLAQEVINNL